MRYKVKITKAAKNLVKVVERFPERYRDRLDRWAENIADEFDMSAKSVRHDINRLVDELM